MMLEPTRHQRAVEAGEPYAYELSFADTAYLCFSAEPLEVSDNLMNNGLIGEVYLRDIVEEKCDYAPPQKLQGSAEKTYELRPACRKLPGLSREKNMDFARLSGNFRGSAEKNTDFAPLVGNFRGSAEIKHGFRPACQELPGLSREKHGFRPLVGNFRSAEKNTITPRLSRNFRGSAEKNVDYRAFRNVGYNNAAMLHRGRMFRLLWTFVDLN